ncbi:hypothetical protein [Ktedonobacter racemifer]|uniref:hypothetical protein n=1 Tax=Ktedonobacter racemifer TaxID=363277 RepID=UPI0002FD0F73|nr:hypothetical protein [Ktedonobacter racemifer]
MYASSSRANKRQESTVRSGELNREWDRQMLRAKIRAEENELTQHPDREGRNW